jgi:hypothetical protein
MRRARVEVRAGGRSLATFAVRASRPDLEGACLRIPAEICRDSAQLDLVLRAPDATSQAQLGVGEDDRPLGFCLRRLAVREPLRYSIGQTLTFGEGGAGGGALAGGWSSPEPTGRWSDGPVAEIVLRLEGRPGPLDLLLAADPYFGSPPRDLRADLRAGGEQIATLVYRAGDAGAAALRHARVAARQIDSLGELVLTIHIHHPQSPADFGASDDSRLLGLHLRSLVLWEAGAEAHAVRRQ